MEKFIGRFYVMCLIVFAITNTVVLGLQATNPLFTVMWVVFVLTHCLCAFFIWRDGVK